MTGRETTRTKEKDSFQRYCAALEIDADQPLKALPGYTDGNPLTTPRVSCHRARSPHTPSSSFCGWAHLG